MHATGRRQMVRKSVAGMRSWLHQWSPGLPAWGSLALATAVLLPQPVRARERQQDFSIASGPLRIALTTFARQSGVQILFAPELVAGKTGHGVHGHHSREDALEKILTGTGLMARTLDSGAILIVPARKGAGQSGDPATLPSPANRDIPQDILVTAFKYPTILADSAADLSVIGAQLQRHRGIVSLETLAQATPSLQLSESNSANQRLTIRGVYGRGEPTVGVYYGDSPISGPSGTTFDPGGIAPDPELVDIDRIELLRGPQGTLYGASSMGGTLRFLFNTPDMTRNTGEIRSGLAFTQDGEQGYNASAVANVMIVEDRLALRAVGYVRHIGGYIDQPRIGQADLGAADRNGVRLALGWSPVPDLEVRLSFLHQINRTNGARFYDDTTGPRINDLEARTPNSNTLDLGSIVVDWGTDWGTLTAAGTLYRWKVVRQTDFTGVIAALVDSASSCQRYNGLPSTLACGDDQWSAYHDFVNSRLPAILYQPMWVTSANSELRFHSEVLAHTALTLGLFAESRHDRVDSITALADARTGLLVDPVDVTGLRSIWTSFDQAAIFGEISYDLLPSLTATGGFRRFHYFKSAYGEVGTPNVITGTADIAPGNFSMRESGSNFKLQLTWRLFPGLMAYLQMADGFRPGGINITPSLSTEDRTYRADSLRSYELGTRFTLPYPALKFQAALYHIDWSDMIYNASSANNAFVYNTNVGSILIDGAEFSVDWKASRDFNLSASGSWTDARLAKDQDRASSLGHLYAGDRIPTIPVLAGTVGLAYERQIGPTSTLWARIDTIASSGFSSQFNELQSGYAHTPARATIDFAIGTDHRAWDLSLVVRNALDDRTPSQITTSSSGRRQLYGATPRTISLEFGRTF